VKASLAGTVKVMKASLAAEAINTKNNVNEACEGGRVSTRESDRGRERKKGLRVI
jgi:hypothetical protein